MHPKIIFGSTKNYLDLVRNSDFVAMCVFPDTIFKKKCSKFHITPFASKFHDYVE